MKENVSTTCLGLTKYTCFDGHIDNDVIDRAVERLANSGSFPMKYGDWGGETARYIAQERTGKIMVTGMIMCDWEDGKIVAPQVETALSKKFNRQSDGTWILK